MGYDKVNCVSACNMCNMMKGSLEFNKFLDVCEIILSNLGIIKINNNIKNYFSQKESVEYIKYKNIARRRGYDFTLSEVYFKEIIKNPCYLCNKQNSLINQNGIDCINDYKGYTEDNCKSC